MTRVVRIASRYNGPPSSANGGYACGLVAAGRSGPFEVRLQAPPPLDTDLELHERDDGVELRAGEVVVARGRPVDVGLTAPEAPAYADVRAAAERFDVEAYAAAHYYPRCFVCGPHRDEGDGLRLFPAPLGGGELCAWPWTPSHQLADGDGAVAEPVLWGALDCPSILAAWTLGLAHRPAVLGSLTAQLHAPLTPGEPVVVGGWPAGEDGRKQYAGSAVWAADGTLLAVARSTWVVLSEEQVRAFAAAT